MQDTETLTDKELAKQLEAFYNFVHVLEYGYLTGEALIHFNALRAEWAKRIDRQAKSNQRPLAQQCQQCGRNDLPLNQQSGLCVRCAIG